MAVEGKNKLWSIHNPRLHKDGKILTHERFGDNVGIIHRKRSAQCLARSKSSVICCFPSLSSTPSTRSPPAPFILFQGHAGGVPNPPSRPIQAPPLATADWFLRKRSGGKSPVGAVGAGRMRGLGWVEEERRRAAGVGGRGGGRAGGGCRGNRGAGSRSPLTSRPGGRLCARQKQEASVPVAWARGPCLVRRPRSGPGPFP